MCKAMHLLQFSLWQKVQKFSKNQFLQLWEHLKSLKFLINFSTILKALLRSNFLLSLCSARKTKNFRSTLVHILDNPWLTSSTRTNERSKCEPACFTAISQIPKLQPSDWQFVLVGQKSFV